MRRVGFAHKQIKRRVPSVALAKEGKVPDPTVPPRISCLPEANGNVAVAFSISPTGEENIRDAKIRYNIYMKPNNKKWLIIVLAIIFVGAVALLLVRGFSGEDDWTCKDGKWQKHGNPSSSQPETVCPIN